MSYDYEDDTIGIIYKESSYSSQYEIGNKKFDRKDVMYNNNCNINDSLMSNTNDLQSEITLTKGSNASNTSSNFVYGKDDRNKLNNDNNNSVLINLKESIRSNFKTIKKEKEKYLSDWTSTHPPYKNVSQHNSERSTIDSKGKSEKEKLQEYYKNIKSNSRLNTSNYNSNNKSNNDNKMKHPNTIREGNDDNFNGNNITIDNSVNIINEYVIYNSFKNMFGANKGKSSQKSINNTQSRSPIQSQTNFFNNYLCDFNHADNQTDSDRINKDITQKSDSEYNLYTDLPIQKTEHIEAANKLESSVLKDLNNLNHLESSQGDSFTNNPKKISYRDQLVEDQLNPNNCNTNTYFISQSHQNKNSKCKRCVFYKNKLNYYKKSLKQYKKKYLKQKKSAEMLNLKLFYEINKNSNNLEKLSSTNVSSTNKVNEEEEKRINKLLLDKIQGNLIVFEKLENELVNKNILIKKQEENIKNQKETIDKLLKQFDVFLSQGNFLINDILLLKQSLFDKNINEVSKEFDVISQTINNYTNRIKEFSEKNKMNMSSNKEDQLAPYEEIESESKDNLTCQELSLSFSKSEFDYNKKSFNYDRSLKLLDLNYSQYNNDFLISRQSNNYSENITETDKDKEKEDYP